MTSSTAVSRSPSSPSYEVVVFAPRARRRPPAELGLHTELVAGLRVETLHEAADAALQGAVAQTKPAGYRGVGHAGVHQLEDLSFKGVGSGPSRLARAVVKAGEAGEAGAAVDVEWPGEPPPAPQQLTKRGGQG